MDARLKTGNYDWRFGLVQTLVINEFLTDKLGIVCAVGKTVRIDRENVIELKKYIRKNPEKFYGNDSMWQDTEDRVYHSWQLMRTDEKMEISWS